MGVGNTVKTSNVLSAVLQAEAGSGPLLLIGIGLAQHCDPWPQGVLEYPIKGVGVLPPPPQAKVTTVGKNEFHNWENLVGLSLVHKFLGPRSPPPLLSSRTSLPGSILQQLPSHHGHVVACTKEA